jgi:hypothetical protein
MCTPLKHALVDHKDPAYRVAYQLGRTDTWLSRVAAGIKDPTEFEKQQLSKILGRTVRELFPVDMEVA